MRQNSIVGYRHRRRVTTTIPGPADQTVPDLRERDFTAPAPNRIYVGDITYVPLESGANLHSATVIDCYSRTLAGWAIADHMRTDLVSAGSFDAALKREVLQNANVRPDEATCRRQVFRWVTRYNTRRRHSWCGHRSPNTYESLYTATLTSAA